jgi:hypothetical protein
MKSFWQLWIPLAAPVFLAGTPVFADDLQKVRSAVNSFLIKAGSGLVSNESMCPSSAGNLSEYVTRIEFAPVDATTNALLLSSETCGGGNKHGQYLYIAKSWGGGDLVNDAEIGDLSFYRHDRPSQRWSSLSPWQTMVAQRSSLLPFDRGDAGIQRPNEETRFQRRA